MNELAPVALFAYNRFNHLRATIDALLENTLADQTNIYIFSDGPRSDCNIKEVQTVRNYLRTLTGFNSITVYEREMNCGLAQSIIEGVTQILRKHEKIIVLEDDLVTSKFFLSYMNEALEKYEDKEDVISVHGYVYPVECQLPETFLMPGADCWGWGTWRRGWQLFNPDGKYLLRQLKLQGKIPEFDFNGSSNFLNMLKDQINGKNDSWAIRWHASAIVNNKLTLYPARSLVHNIGNDDSGTHSSTSSYLDTLLSSSKVDVNLIENYGVFENARKAFKQFFDKNSSRKNKSALNLCVSKVLSRLINKK